MRDEKIFARVYRLFFFLCCDIGGRKDGRKKEGKGKRGNFGENGKFDAASFLSIDRNRIASTICRLHDNVVNRVKRKKDT